MAILPLEAKLVANRGEVDDCRNGQGRLPVISSHGDFATK